MITVTFNSNDESNSQICFATVAGDFTLPADDTFTSVGGEFKGWGTTADGDAIDGTTISVTEDTVIYALWKTVLIYTITFDGAGAAGSMDDVKVNEGGTYTLPENTFTYTYKTFAGWLVNGEPKQVGDTIDVAGDITVTAKWVDVNLKWTTPSVYGEIDITVNLSKPEKDPKAIAAAKALPQSDYPKCALCAENEAPTYPTN